MAFVIMEIFTMPSIKCYLICKWTTAVRSWYFYAKIAIGCGFWATICKTVRPMLSVRCLSVCNIRALWPNVWTDQDEIWHAGRPRPLATLC